MLAPDRHSPRGIVCVDPFATLTSLNGYTGLYLVKTAGRGVGIS